MKSNLSVIKPLAEYVPTVSGHFFLLIYSVMISAFRYALLQMQQALNFSAAFAAQGLSPWLVSLHA